jgi:hypothetical protein
MERRLGQKPEFWSARAMRPRGDSDRLKFPLDLTASAFADQLNPKCILFGVFKMEDFCSDRL